MEILRARLFESDNHQHGISFLNMPRSTGRRAGEALPCKAKRRLFQDDSPPSSGLENRQAQANLRINTEASNNDNPSESERLQERFADIEVFEDPPTPYRTVCHSAGKRNGLESTRKVEEVDENVEEPTSSRMNSSRSSVTEKQSRLPEYFKPKKRARTTSSPLQKTPRDQMRTRQAATSRRQRASTLK